jgi:gliding motility-associated-like protein
MTGNSIAILKIRTDIVNSIIRWSLLGLSLLLPVNGYSQVINNTGADVNVTAGTVVTSRDATNSAGSLLNSGTINLSGNFTNTATTSANGTFRIGGNWTNSGGIFNPGTSTVIFNGANNQLVTRLGGETFFNMSVINSGAPGLNRVGISNNVTVLGTLSMSSGNIDAGTFKLILSNPVPGALDYTSVTGSRVFGKFERGVNQTGTYLFPLGTSANYNPANVITNNVTTPGTIISEFLTPPSIDSLGLPLPDPPDEVARVFQDGYWHLTSSGFASNNYNINLDGSGFTTFPIRDMTRIITRTTGTDWTLDGTHTAATGNVTYRNTLTAGISASGSQYALAQTRPRIIKQPRDTIVCENDYPEFEVFVTSTRALTYKWYKEPNILLTGPHYNTTGPGVLRINGVVLADAGEYYCIITDYYGVSVRSASATLTVNRRPVATATPSIQAHECSNVAFDNIVLGEIYGVPGTTYLWTRDNPSGITSLIPLSGTAPNIGDFLSGTFTNTTDSPITVTFSITPVGPGVTFCTGQTITATVTVNPTPRVIPLNLKPDVCDIRNPNASLIPTSVTLTTPSVMTMGVIKFDYTISVTGTPGDIIGTTTGTITDIIPGSPSATLNYSYQNITDTVHTVSYAVTPKVVGLGCPNGVVEVPEVRVHPLPLPRLPMSIDITDPLTCGDGSDYASLRAIISRGAAPYNIVWDRLPLGSGMHEVNVTDVSVPYGWYQVQVTDNALCYRVDSVNILPKLANGIISPTIIEPGNYHVTCVGDNDGQIFIAAINGITPPYDYWVVRGTSDTVASGIFSNNLNPMEPTTFRVVTGLTVGKYTLIIRDINGCYVPPSSVTLSPPPPMISVLKAKVYDGNYNISCKAYNDGSAWVQSITGRIGTFKYRWWTTNGSIPGPINTYRIDNITAGKYYVEIKDTLDCIKIDSITIVEPDGMSLAGSTLSRSRDGNFNISCFNGNDGSISLSIAGGSGVFNYSWTGPSGFSATTRDISDLKAGVYTLTVRDMANPSNPCILTPNPVFTLTEPALLTVTPVKSLSDFGGFNINCSGSATGTIDLTVTGGSVGTYIYNWSTANGSGLIAGQEDQFTLTAGIYNVAITDSNLCTVATSVTLTEPTPLALTLVPTHITCQSPGFSNGSVDLTPSGGVPPYLYSWSNGAVTQDINGLTQGYYKVTVRDANNCRKTDSVLINLPPSITYTSSLSDHNGFNVSCFGKSDGSVTISNISGAPPFIFSWTGPSGFTSASQSISGVKAGSYQLLITDSNSCIATGNFNLSEPGKLSMTITPSSSTFGGFNINCAGAYTGSIDIDPVNPAGAVTYLWSDGIVGKTRTGLAAGTYKVIILDQNNCSTDSIITLSEPDTIEIDFEVVQAFCPDSPDGQISTTVTGGVIIGNYSYQWSDADNSSNQNLSDILKGHYVLRVTDANGCQAKDSLDMEPLNETCLIIPNAISPNDDGINDVWNIGMTHLYPQMEVRVYNSWGQKLWNSTRGYTVPWDGRSNGEKLPIDSYHYVIDLHNGSKPVVGTITILR